MNDRLTMFADYLAGLGEGTTYSADGLTEYDHILDGPFEASCVLDYQSQADNDERLTAEEIQTVLDSVGMVLSSDDNGALSVDVYCERQAYADRCSTIESAWTDYDADAFDSCGTLDADASDSMFADCVDENEFDDAIFGETEFAPLDDNGKDLIEISIPEAFRSLCSDYAGDTDCLLRAIDSTGGLTLGTIRPYSDDVGRKLTNEEWQVSLFSSLGADIRCVIRQLNPVYADYRTERERLERFERWAEYVGATLKGLYGLTESDAV